MNYLGDYATGATVYVPFHTFDSAGASITITGLAVTDIEIYKNGSVTQRASDSGYTLLDTDGIDFDGVTGIHGFSIDLSDNTDSGFYAAGNDYWVVVSAITVDTQTVSFVAATFSIANRVVASVTGAVGSVTGNVGGNVTGSVGSLATQAKADVNAEADTAISDAALATAAALATVDTNVDSILADTGTDGVVVASLAAGSITAAAIATDAIDADALAADAVAEINATVDTAISDAALATAASLATVDTNVDAILADTGTDGVVLSAATYAAIADVVLRRTAANIEASANGDTLDPESLYGLLQAAFNATRASTVLTIRKTDNTTLGTRTITTDAAADPVTAITD